MSEAWLHFAIVIFVQFLFLIVHAAYKKILAEVPRILGWSILVGLGVGLSFDLILGRFLGLYSYTLGFGAFFLILNATLSYGLFAAHTLLMQKERLVHFYIWIISVVAVYETTNYFFSVWIWEFTLPYIAFFTVLLIGYFGGAVLIATIWHRFFNHRFSFITHRLQK